MRILGLTLLLLCGLYVPAVSGQAAAVQGDAAAVRGGSAEVQENAPAARKGNFAVQEAAAKDQGQAAAARGGSAVGTAQEESSQAGTALLEELELEEIEQSLSGLMEFSGFSFSRLVKQLISGEIPLEAEAIASAAGKMISDEVKSQKALAIRILVTALVSAIFSNFIRIFNNNQIAEISFYMMYLMISVLLIRSFSAMQTSVAETLQNLSSFMRVLLPSYLITIVCSSGPVTALGFYQITLLAIHILQLMLIKIVLPLVQLYLVLLILNQMMREDFFSRLAELIRTVAEWMIRTALGVTIGLQAVQCLTAPAVDALKGSAAHRLARAIPGIGGILDAAAETVIGSAVVIRNAVGVAGMAALLLICLAPLFKLAVSILVFRILCALIQPISEKRMVECIGSIASGVSMLMRILLAGLSMFLILIAMIAASLKGG